MQKGFGLPPGLCVLILSPKAIKKARKMQKSGEVIGSYHSLVKLVEKTREFQTTQTPNILGIYLLGCVVRDFLKVGILDLRKRIDQQAQMLYSFFSKPEYYNASLTSIASSAYKQSLPMPGGIGRAYVKEERY